MRKTAAFLLCFCLLFAGSVTVFAQEITQTDDGGSAVISVTVPDSHMLTVSVDHAEVFIGSVSGTSFNVERLSEPTLLIQPENGYRVTKVTLNGEDVTEQVQGGYYTLEPVYGDKQLVVEAEQVPASSDSTHNISGTVNDENGDPISGATVEIGGKTDVTDEDGNFAIEDVPDGYHPIIITDEDGNIIGYTELEIGGGEPGVTQNPDGSYTLTAPKNADLGLELTATEDGKLSVGKVTDITTEQPSDPSDDSEGPQTGDDSNIFLWIILMFVSGVGVIGITFRNKKRDCGTK